MFSDKRGCSFVYVPKGQLKDPGERVVFSSWVGSEQSQKLQKPVQKQSSLPKAPAFWLSSTLQKESSLWPHPSSSRSAAVPLTDVQPYRRSLDCLSSLYKAGRRRLQHSLGSQRQTLFQEVIWTSQALGQRCDVVLGYILSSSLLDLLRTLCCPQLYWPLHETTNQASLLLLIIVCAIVTEHFWLVSNKFSYSSLWGLVILLRCGKLQK